MSPACYLAYLWNARSKLWTHDLTTGLEGALGYYAASVAYLFPYESFTMDQILNWGQANGVSAERLAYAKSLLFVTLDGDLSIPVRPHQRRRCGHHHRPDPEPAHHGPDSSPGRAHGIHSGL